MRSELRKAHAAFRKSRLVVREAMVVSVSKKKERSFNSKIE